MVMAVCSKCLDVFLKGKCGCDPDTCTLELGDEILLTTLEGCESHLHSRSQVGEQRFCFTCYTWSDAECPVCNPPIVLYDVHAYAVVRVKMPGIPATSMVKAIGVALSAADFDALLTRGEHQEYAEEISHYLVDVVGDEQYEQTRWFDANEELVDPLDFPAFAPRAGR